MASIWGELRRRNVVKVAAAYAIVGWLVVEVASTVLPTFEAPQWVLQTVTFVIILGFPFAVILAWAFELTPEGIKAASAVSRAESAPRPAGQGLTYVSHGLVLLAVGFLVLDQYVLDQGMRAGVAERDVSTISGPGTSAPGTADSGVLRFTLDLGTRTTVGDTALDAHVALSPDGSQLVYAAQVEGGSRLFRRQLDQFETHLMPGTEGAYHPFFSPDGEWVGFYTEQVTSPSLKKVSVRGGSPQTLAGTSMSTGGSWEVDDTIVYGTGGETGRSLFRLPANGGPSEILLPGDAEGGYVRPEVLPGGEAVLFTARPAAGGAGNARDGRIGVLRMATGEVQTLIEGGYAPQYAPTGHIVFVRGDSLWAVPFDVERLETTGAEVPVVEGVQSDGFRGSAVYAFSDNGLLVYAPGGDVGFSGGLNMTLVWVDAGGREEPLAFPLDSYFHARLSPDGRRLATAMINSGSSDIWILDLERGTPSRLTFGPGDEQRPLWTQDGQHIVYWSTLDVGLFRRAASGTGQPERLTTNSNVQQAEAFSPDGTRLVLRDFRRGNWDLYVLSMGGDSAPEPLLETNFNEWLAAISPDGRWLAYVSDESGRSDVYVRPFPNVDGGQWQISRDGGEEPRWGREGRELFYRSTTGALIRVSIEGESELVAGTPEEVLAGNHLFGLARPTWDISPDGRRFLMADVGVSTPEGNSIAVVENWFEELNRLAPPSE